VKQGQRYVAASVRARLLERAHAEQSDFQLLLTRYVLERLLYRLSVSKYRARVILKGALLLSVWVSDRFRPTRDLDLLGYGECSPAVLAGIFSAICAEPVPDDGVIFEHERLDAALIRQETEYGGVRIRTTATVAGARIPVQVDIGCGDAITPAPIEIEYPALLQFPAPHLWAYPVETVVSEKVEAVVVLGMANSRLKDYYDLFLISHTFTLEQRLLAEAVRRTFERRGTALPEGTPVGLTNEFAASSQVRWRGFLGRERMLPVPDDLAVVVTDLHDFLVPVIHGLDQGLTWLPGGPWLPK
jgi:hypothetical protein